MIYLDTSAIAPFYWPEDLSDRVVNVLKQEPDRTISDLTAVEFYSALSRRVRTQEISPSNAQRVIQQFQRHLESGFYQTITPGPHHYSQAQQWLIQFNTPLRALDALHLAIAHNLNRCLVTADSGLARSAQILNIPLQHLSLE